MFTIFRYTLGRFRGQIIGWGLAVFLLAALLISFYDTVRQQSDQIQNLVSSYPPAMLAMFGIDAAQIEQFTTPAGYLSTEYFSFTPIILGIFVILAGSGLLASDEENGTLDLIAAHPISRSALFAGRLLAMLVATAAVLALGWLGLVIPAVATGFPATPGALALPFVSMFGVLALFGALALLLSLLLPARRVAAMTAGLLLMATFFLNSFKAMVPGLEAVARLSPLNYYQSGDAMQALDGGSMLGLLIATVLLIALAWWRFQARDIRVTGEGGWRMPRFGRRAAA